MGKVKEVAGLQTATNIGTAIANRNLSNTNQITPYGNLTNKQTGTTKYTDPVSGKTFDIPQFTSTTTLAPGQQNIFNKTTAAGGNIAGTAQNLSGQLGGILGQPLQTPNLSGVGAGPNLRDKFAAGGPITKTYGTDFSADRQRVEDALMQRMQPGMDQDRLRLEANLANRGIKLGSTQYDRAKGIAGQNVNDARLGAVLAGGEEQSRMTGLEAQRAAFQNQAQQQQFGQNATRAGFSNDANQQEFTNSMAGRGFNNNMRQQGFQNQITGRQQPLNELGSLFGMGQVQNPQFQPQQPGGIPTTDYAGLSAAHNQAQAQKGGNGLMGGLFGLGSSAITAGAFDGLGAALPGIFAMSDRRLKTDVKRIGSWKDLPLYLFRYVWGGPLQVGVMAQDVLKVKPAAVVMVGGYLAVNYGAL